MAGLGAGCGSEASDNSEPVAAGSWSLVANEDGGLIDTRAPERGAYPNPRKATNLTVSWRKDGKVCAHNGTETWCGGAVQGIPYKTTVKVEGTTLCKSLKDIYGNEVEKRCGAAVCGTDDDDGICIQTETKEGEACEICADQYGEVVKNTCKEKEEDDQECTKCNEAPPICKTPADGVKLGLKLLVEKLNANLKKAGISVQVSEADISKLVDYEGGDLSVGDASCDDITAYLEDEFSDDGEGTDDFVFGPEAIKECKEKGRCRIGQLITRSMAQACQAIPPECKKRSVEDGIIGGGGQCVKELCDGNSDIKKCVGSPLVLDLAGDGLSLRGIQDGLTFPLFGQGSLKTGWVAGSDDALLAVDFNNDGQITTGRELFGEATGGWAPDGFAALARFDANKDGQISAADPVYSRLLAWTDNGDAVSTKSELRSLKAVGVQSIALKAQKTSKVDGFGNEVGLRSVAQSQKKGSVSVFDVWFSVKR